MRNATRQAGTRPVYSVHPGVGKVQKWVAELPQTTGRSADEWVTLVRKLGPPTEHERRDWLKKSYKLGTNSAAWIAARASGKGTELDNPEAYLLAAEKYVEAMYAGAKVALRPIYDALLDLGLQTGPDVKAGPCKTMVPLYRNHVFAQIKPTTNDRIDLGLSLGKCKTSKRLIDTGGYEKKDRITHRVPISQIAEIDEEVKQWLKTAYNLDVQRS
jgi:hypothetical protein